MYFCVQIDRGKKRIEVIGHPERIDACRDGGQVSRAQQRVGPIP
jgi:hypothetical protein